MAKIQFRNKAHRDFVFENLEKCRHNDCYHQAFFYVMGISEETRMNIGKMFDFKNDCIVPEGMYGGWQTSGTVKVCTLPLIFGTVLQRRKKKIYSHRMNCSVADMLPTLWRVSNSGIPNIVEI